MDRASLFPRTTGHATAPHHDDALTGLVGAQTAPGRWDRPVDDGLPLPVLLGV